MRLFHRKKECYDPTIIHIYLHDALRLISEEKYDAAYEAICWAIIKSNGKLKDKETNKFDKLLKERD